MTRAKPTFNQINVVVADMDRSQAFYRRLGVGVSDAPFPAGSAWRHAQADVGGDFDFAFDNTAFAPAWNAGWKDRDDLAGRVVVGFGVEDRQAVDDLYAEMVASGAKGLQPPFDAFWGARYAILEDPDGLAIGLMSRSDPAMRRAP